MFHYLALLNEHLEQINISEDARTSCATDKVCNVGKDAGTLYAVDVDEKNSLILSMNVSIV